MLLVVNVVLNYSPILQPEFFVGLGIALIQAEVIVPSRERLS